jgi:hypothetical protein
VAGSSQPSTWMSLLRQPSCTRKPSETSGIRDRIALARPWRYDAQSRWISRLFILPITSLFLALGCSDGAGADCHHSCPISTFALDVPADRVDDVASVTPTGPCASESVSGSALGVYFFRVTGDGVCQVTISFRSGAPDFVASVNVIPNAGPCCVGQPTAEKGSISVPELGSVDASPGN